jgi:hypothetical protein
VSFNPELTADNDVDIQSLAYELRRTAPFFRGEDLIRLEVGGQHSLPENILRANCQRIRIVAHAESMLASQRTMHTVGKKRTVRLGAEHNLIA